MYLGADAELSMRPKSLAPGVQQLLPITVAERGSPKKELPHGANDSCGPMDIDDSDVPAPSNSVSILDMQVAQITDSITKSVKREGPVLLVTLEHGDILIFNGDDFKVHCGTVFATQLTFIPTSIH